MFSVVAKKSQTFSSLPYSATEQVCRSWEGAQPGSWPRLADGNIPYHGHHAQFMNGGWSGRRKLSAFLFSMSSNPLLAGSLNVFWAANLSSSGEEYRIVCSLFCIFIIIIIIIIITITSISFVVLLNWFYLIPQVFPIVHCPSHPTGGKGRGEQVAVWCLAASCWVKLQQEFAGASWCRYFKAVSDGIWFNLFSSAGRTEHPYLTRYDWVPLGLLWSCSLFLCFHLNSFHF